MRGEQKEGLKFLLDSEIYWSKCPSLGKFILLNIACHLYWHMFVEFLFYLKVILFRIRRL
jgi:hypothetical protein